MTIKQQRSPFQKQIKEMVYKLLDQRDPFYFKEYILGALVYRCISENFTNFIEADDVNIKYAQLPDKVITPEIKHDVIKTKGYCIYPSQLFDNVKESANTNRNLCTDLTEIFSNIENSAKGYPSEWLIKRLFSGFDTSNRFLGETVNDKNAFLAKLLIGVANLELGDFKNSEINLFGEAYAYLMGLGGAAAGSCITQNSVSKLLTQIVMHKQHKVNRIYDPACGSCTTLLHAQKYFKDHIIEEGFFGQDIDYMANRMARMNMLMHDIDYVKFDIRSDNTLTNPHFGDEMPFDAIVSDPPCPLYWPESSISKSRLQFSFVEHALSYLSNNGRAAITCFPGILSRCGGEQKVRQYLVDNNYIETVILLPPLLNEGSPNKRGILVLSRNKQTTHTQFIDASCEGFFTRVTYHNVIEDEHIQKIMDMFEDKGNRAEVAATVPYEQIVNNNYDLTVEHYVYPDVMVY